MVTARVCSKLKQAENGLFLQIKSGRILWAFLIKHYSTRACWIGDDYYQLISNAHSWNKLLIIQFWPTPIKY